MKAKLLILFLSMSFFANAQWEYVNALPETAYSLIVSNNNLYAGLSGGGVYKSMDNGNTWIAVNNGIQFGGAYIFSLASSNDSIYAGGFGEVCFSDNGGSNWSLLNLNLDLNNFVYALILKGNYLFAGVGHGMDNGVYRKPVNGNVWSLMNSGLPDNTGVNAFAIHNDLLFAGTNAGVYVSANDGDSWTWSGDGINPGLTVKSLITMSGNILAGTTNGVYVSSDNGINWVLSNGLPSNSVGVSFAKSDNQVVSGTYESAFSSADKGFNWSVISNEPYSIVSFYSMAFLDGYFYAGTGHGFSILRFAENVLSVPETDSKVKPDYSIFPNPFSSQTTFRVNIFLQNATLTAYNSFGQTVKQIENILGNSFDFSRDNLANGMYFIQLTQGNKILVADKLVVTNN
jgi:photosystem II stability/assembly factor-like uncharacterized protein